jgi:hypothetical protein
MAVTRNYDEMADRYTYFGSLQQIRKEKHGIGQIYVQPGFVDLKDGGDTFWFMFHRKGDDWRWLSNTDFIILADNQRFSGVGYVQDSKVTEEMGWFETKVLCNEWIHCGTSVEIMRVIASSSSLKMRLGDVDMTLPQAFIADVNEIVAAINNGQSYGAE